MAPSPKKIEEYKNQSTTIALIKKPKSVSNCFTLPSPPKPGMVPVSTLKVNKEGCLILDWQPQQVTILVSDSQQWYSYATKALKVTAAGATFSALAIIVLLILVIKRGRFGV